MPSYFWLFARPDDSAIRSSRIVNSFFTPGVGSAAGKICHALLERDVCTDYRGDGLRVSPHFFNTEDEIDRCFEELRALL